MAIYNFIIPINGYLRLTIEAENPIKAGEQIVEHRRELETQFPNLALDLQLSDSIVWDNDNDNDNINESKG